MTLLVKQVLKSRFDQPVSFAIYMKKPPVSVWSVHDGTLTDTGGFGS